MREITRKNKKGLSEVVGYVLLIGVAVSLSVIVYYWINSNLPKNTNDCPEISIIISNYQCKAASKEINITLQNKGLFDIDGFILKASNDSSAPTKSLKYYNGTAMQSSSLVLFDTELDVTLNPSEKFIKVFNYSDPNINILTKIQIIPFKFYKGETLLCGKAEITQNVEGCG